MLMNWLGLLLVLFGPVVLFAAAIHILQRTTQRRLAERFGWKSVLWTGWLGTPVHELSHVVMCLVFRHRIDDVSLFEPDPESGRLGYVRHSWRVGNWYEELGNVFIGLAPLIGGSATLLGLLWIFYPDTFAGPVVATINTGGVTPVSATLGAILTEVWGLVTQLLQWSNLTTVKFWVFVYLVLCVGSHMAPSWSDYRGTGRGTLLLLSLLTIGLLIASFFIADVPEFQIFLLSTLSPLLALFAITLVLCVIAAAITLLAINYFPKRFEVS